MREGFQTAMTAIAHPSSGARTRAKRILAVASGGGHGVQLLRLRPAFLGEHVAYVTVSRAYRAEVGPAPFYIVNDATRWAKLSLIRLCVQMVWIMLRERPDIVVTTGAAPGYFGVFLGRFFGAKTVWIDSMANVDRLSLCGQKIGRGADLWLTQWPSLATSPGPSYGGAVV